MKYQLWGVGEGTHKKNNVLKLNKTKGSSNTAQ